MGQREDTDRKEHSPLVLVVEDEPFLREIAVKYLEECGFSVLHAETADEAVNLLQEHEQIDAVFSDIQVPGDMDGLDLAEWTRRERPEVGVLLTSGQVAPGNARDWPLLAKPYKLDEVERQLRDLVQLS